MAAPLAKSHSRFAMHTLVHKGGCQVLRASAVSLLQCVPFTIVGIYTLWYLVFMEIHHYLQDHSNRFDMESIFFFIALGVLFLSAGIIMYRQKTKYGTVIFHGDGKKIIGLCKRDISFADVASLRVLDVSFCDKQMKWRSSAQIILCISNEQEYLVSYGGHINNARKMAGVLSTFMGVPVRVEHVFNH